MEIKLTIQPQRIADMMVTAIECNEMTRSWCDGLYWKSQDCDPPDLGGDPWYAHPEIYQTSDFKLEVIEIEDEVTGALKSHFINLDDLAKGFAIMAKDYPQSFAHFMGENEDAFTADTWLQCVVLGQTVYG